MADRSLGWVQNPSDFKKLKDVVSVFVRGTSVNKKLVNEVITALIEDSGLRQDMIEVLSKETVEIEYSLLKGKGSGGLPRSEAPCTGIIQAIIPSQSGRPYTDDWTADGFLRWAISIGLLLYNKKKDTCTITALGEQFVSARGGSEDEQKILIRAFLSYPPAVRVLHLLNEQGHLTKFELGKQLGGLGEPGFTSIPQELYVQGLEISPEDEKSKIRSNTEGSADKYARMIAGWLCKVGLVQRVPKEQSVTVGSNTYETIIGHAYQITLKGIREIKKTEGLSSVARVPKIVYWEMLATKVRDRDYIRTRRGMIIQSIHNKEKTLTAIQADLKKEQIIESEITVKDEINVINAMGLNVQESRGVYSIRDDIVGLTIPLEKPPKTRILEMKDCLRQRLKKIDHRYLALLDLAYHGSAASRDFEVQTVDLFTNALGLKGVRLGESRKPDGIVSHDKVGIILDNKAYREGYELPMTHADEMIRYIVENHERDPDLNPNEWWLNFEPKVDCFHFLFVTSYLKGRFKSNLEYIANRTGVSGAAIDVVNLLRLAELLKSAEMSHEDFFSLFQNEEIVIGSSGFPCS